MNDSNDKTTAPAPAAAAAGNPKRKKALLGVGALVAVGAIGYGAYWALVLNHHETTDNAYVQGNVVQVTPQLGGTVVAIGADDTDHVKAGQMLVELDPADARVALDQAEAQLAQAVREVRTLYANNSTLGAQVAARQADVARARSELARAQDDVARRQPLVVTGAVGTEEFRHVQAQLDAARSTVAAAESALQAAREQLGASQTQTEGVAVDQHPNVLRAAARVRESWLALQRAKLVAPVDGYVAKRSVQLGQRVAAGTPLLSVIALDRVWVEANFKESQLANLRIGQPVELTADVYGSKAAYHGRIEGLGAGTGAAFALLPAQNATGNWIKVVQRVPVRVTLDPNELAAHPLRVGLSMEAKVDTHDTAGAMLADGARAPVPTQTRVFDNDDAKAQAEVDRIVAANGGRAGSAKAGADVHAAAQPRRGVPASGSRQAAAATATVAARTR